MKITMICDVLGEANNGTTLAALNLITHLRSKGHDLTVCITRCGPVRSRFCDGSAIESGLFVESCA